MNIGSYFISLRFLHRPTTTEARRIHRSRINRRSRSRKASRDLAAEADATYFAGAAAADDDIRRKSANYEIIGTMQSTWGPLFAGLAHA
ncbi:MAG: hypothetical protein EBW39_10285, partial [Betaproteobacteria bacterium]|nr:hypothetical protein [Betaproteobacteria bacterium]